ncbi:RNA polymerase sigma-70 factor [Evansella sp. LMS18]|uniref:RNA polymerase sigma-70 factor n=1 Tax=Evansella sp. LMS18 TaxID=2924033 RepID=UPI0020D017D1|nr:RNA polymerase sigma-70 factor [Evansella sp. LMS18]UTR10747.1 RNA polymerase sigma-70 factor [Evansella sp. LMS18]
MQITNEEYMKYRPLLFSLGYRLLGSVKDVEDLVQETFLRAYQINEVKLENKKAYLCKVMTNCCLDLLKSARFRREQYIGPWLPEPLWPDDLKEKDPSETAIQKEGLSIAYLRMMENLSPHERAVFLLREVFSFSYAEISSFIEKQESSCRQLNSRAKKKLSAVSAESLDYEKNKSLILRFIEAFQTKNTTELLKLVSEEVILYSDGGGIVKAAIRPIVSSRNVLSFIFGIIKKMPDDFIFEVKRINGQPAVVNRINGELHSVISFYIINERIKEIYMLLNPEKLNQK